MLTHKQHDLLVFINIYMMANNGVSPSFGEMATARGVKSKNTIHRQVCALRDAGFLTFRPACARSIAILKMPGKASVIDEIAAERQRQIEAEGWTAEHDDMHDDCSLVTVAACYAVADWIPTKSGYVDGGWVAIPALWPASWKASWWKPKDRRRDLIRAAALLVAEIERLDRKEQEHEKDTDNI